MMKLNESCWIDPAAVEAIALMHRPGEIGGGVLRIVMVSGAVHDIPNTHKDRNKGLIELVEQVQNAKMRPLGMLMEFLEGQRTR